MKNIKYRHEFKYLLTETEAIEIELELSKLINIDNHAKNGVYKISSLYFDNIDNQDFNDVDAGVDDRKKFRIRIYNNSSNNIKLECKSKKSNMTSKNSDILSYNQAKTYLSGKYLRENNNSNSINYFNYNIMANGYKPVIIVEYERIPFVCRNGNTRITIDKNLCASNDIKNFLENYRFKRPIMPLDTCLLEVKYDDFIPEIIYNCLNQYNLKQISFSKYYLCRKFNTGGFDL